MITGVSRLAGLARDAVCARGFGTGAGWSAFTFAFQIPNLFRRLFGEGALSAAFLPEYTRLLGSDPAMARRFANRVLAQVCILLGVIVVVLEAILLGIRAETAGGADVQSRRLALDLMMIMAPYMPMICLTAVLGAMLQSRGRFAPTAASPIVLNTCIIVPAVFAVLYAQNHESFNLDTGLYYIAWGILVSGVLQSGWSWYELQRLRARGLSAELRPESLDAMRAEVRQRTRIMWRLVIPMVIGLGALQLNTLFDGLVASYPVLIGPTIFGWAYPLDHSSQAVLGFAQRLYQFPLGVFGIAVATAIFPELARTSEDHHAFHDTIVQGLRLSWFIGLPASLGLMLVAAPMTTVIYAGGAFGADDVARVAAVLRAYAPAVCAYSLIHILTRAFYARNDSMTPLKCSVSMVLLNVVLNLTLIWPLGESGLAWSTSVCAVIQVGLLWVVLRKRHMETESRLLEELFASMVRTTIASAAMFATVWLISAANPWKTEQNYAAACTGLAVMCAGGILTFAVCSRLLKMQEWRWLFRS